MRGLFTRHLHSRQSRCARVAQHSTTAVHPNDLLFAVVVRLACHLPMCTCALVPRATTAPRHRPPLVVSCAPLDDFILMVGRAAVTTVTANCTQCTAGKYQDKYNQQVYECIPCFTGAYAAGVYAPLICLFRWNHAPRRLLRVFLPYSVAS